MGLSTEKILHAVVRKIRELSPALSGNYLDIGAGHGKLIRIVRDEFKLAAHACDYTPNLMRLPDVPVDVADLNTERLPYGDDEFDLVTCTEVIEHIEHYRRTMREIYRVLQPNGILVLSTPNVLSLRSRIRYLLFGFFTLFGPLHVPESDRFRTRGHVRFLTGGHINPVSYFYLAHALSDAGFAEITATIDRYQRGAVIPLIFLWLPIQVFSLIARHREKSRYKTIDAMNERFVREMNSLDLLLGRTVVVGCRKPR
ncbi:MAG: class I SAM-dependent methyltransferase [Chthoniobacterales bacterium]|nr:class I SAM-dependent methyltransferase [Chthoniobacterales bacterium]